MTVVVDLLADLLGSPGQFLGQWNGEQLVDGRAGLALESLLHFEHVHLVVVHRVQGRRCRRWHPCGGSACLWLPDLLLDHVGHQLGHRPHAFADLSLAREAGGKAGVDVGVFVRLDPRRALHRTLADHRAGLHRGVDFVASPVQETGVDEHNAVGRGFDAGLEVDGGAAFLVHDADLHGALRQPQHVFDATEQLAGEGHLGRAVHFGLDDVDGTGAAIGQWPIGFAGFEPVNRGQAGEQRIHDAFEHLVAIRVDDRIVGHQMADVADEQKAAAGQAKLLAAFRSRGVGDIRPRRGVDAVGVERAGEGLAVLVDLLGQVTLVQPKPVAVAQHLVLGIDGRHRVFKVHDRGDRRFQHHVLDSGGVCLADR